MKSSLRLIAVGFLACLCGFASAQVKRPLLPGYVPEVAETYYSLSYQHASGDSRTNAFGSGISTLTPSSSFSNSSSSINLTHRINEVIVVSVGQGYLIDSKANGVNGPSGRSNLGLGLGYLHRLSDDEVSSVNFGISPKTGSRELRGRDLTGSVGASYAKKMSNQYWLGVNVVRNFSSSDVGDAYGLGLSFSKDFGAVSGSVGLSFTKRDSYHAGGGVIVKSDVSPSIDLALSGRVSKSSHWVISFAHTNFGDDNAYAPNGAGYLSSRGSTDRIGISFNSSF